MNEGDIILTPLPQADGDLKNRPALLLRELPPYGDFLACGISTQLQQAVPGFDEVIAKGDADFELAGLLAESLVRLGFLAVLPRERILGSIGAIGPARHARLLENLSKYLVANLQPAPGEAMDSDPE
jgi:mRNA interferase MazF